MHQAQNGSYVASSDYDKLDEALRSVLDMAVGYFKDIEEGKLTTDNAEVAIRCFAKFLLGS